MNGKTRDMKMLSLSSFVKFFLSTHVIHNISGFCLFIVFDSVELTLIIFSPTFQVIEMADVIEEKQKGHQKPRAGNIHSIMLSFSNYLTIYYRS